MTIFFSGSALSDLEEIKNHYQSEAPYAGERFVVSIFEYIETLQDNPDIERMIPEFQEPSFQELIHLPFRIVYLRKSNSIHVVRVWRSECVHLLWDQDE